MNVTDVGKRDGYDPKNVNLIINVIFEQERMVFGHGSMVEVNNDNNDNLTYKQLCHVIKQYIDAKKGGEKHMEIFMSNHTSKHPNLIHKYKLFHSNKMKQVIEQLDSIGYENINKSICANDIQDHEIEDMMIKGYYNKIINVYIYLDDVIDLSRYRKYDTFFQKIKDFEIQIKHYEDFKIKDFEHHIRNKDKQIDKLTREKLSLINEHEKLKCELEDFKTKRDELLEEITHYIDDLDSSE